MRIIAYMALISSIPSLMALSGIILSGCAAHQEPVPAKITNVSRVFFMGSGSYVVLTENPETKEIKQQYLYSNKYNIKVFADCPNDGKMWVDGVIMDGKPTYIIHVRSSDDIVGGNTGGKHSSPINVVK